ncbi:MAG: PQQ-binding-like beta-propeller repeat protein [Lentisphaeria bacterium]|nr:PQQ-binding-like beta-propeller repeat protein [Lentisphaeria bacterium]
MKSLFSFLLFLPLLLAAENIFTIVHLSDIHVSPSNPQKITTAERAIDEINNNPEVDLVVVSGDLNNHGSREEFVLAKRLYERIKKAKIVVPGNHEVHWGFDGGKRYTETFGATPSVTLVGNIPVFALNTSPAFQYISSHIRSGELEFLKREAAKYPEAPFVIVVGHYSPIQKDLSNWFDLPRALRQAGVKKALILSGHIHRFHLMRWLEYPGLVGRSLWENDANKGAPPGYVIIRISEDGTVTAAEKFVDGREEPVRYTFKLGDAKSLKNISSGRDLHDKRYQLKAPAEAKKVFDIQSTTTSGAAVWENFLAVAADDFHLRIYDLNTGKKLRQIRIPGIIYGALTAGNGVVAGGMDNSTIAGFDIAGGRMIWQIKAHCPVLSPGVFRDGILYTGLGKNEFAAIEMKSGKVLWQVPCGSGAFQASPAVSGELIITSSWDGNYYALDRKSGKILWQKPAVRSGERHAPGNSRPVIAGKYVILSSFNGGFAAEAETGKTVFSFKGRESLGASADGKTGFVRTGKGIIAFELNSTKFTRKFEIKDNSSGYSPFPILEIAGNIWYGNTTGEVKIFDRTNGKLLKKISCGFSSVVGIVPAADGTVWVTLSEGKILQLPQNF